MSEPTLKQLQDRAAFRDRTAEIRKELENDRLPAWEREGLRKMLDAEYAAAGFNSNRVFNGSIWVDVPSKR